MFFSDDLLTTKKGTFGVIWLAATLGPRTKRITRKDLSTVDLSKTCELIAEPPEPMALRLSGCLLVGVARVYNQNYEIFYTDVTQFHTAIRRSFATEFSAAGNTGGMTAGVDLIGDGKSRFDAITFTGLDIGLQSGFDFDFGFDYINWNDPLGKRKRRRNSSKLDSLPSQQEEEEYSSGDSSEDDDTNDGSEMPKRRDKRSKIDSSPLIGPHRDTTLKRTSLYPASDPLDAFDQNLDFGGDQPIDLGLMDTMGDTSISGPSGRDFELPEDGLGDLDIDMGIQNLLNDPLALGDVNNRLQTPEAEGVVAEQKSKKRALAGSVEPEEEDESGEPKKAKKPKKKRTVAVEDFREINAENITPAGYRALMNEHNNGNKSHEEEIILRERAERLVGAGGFEFHDMDDEIAEMLSGALQPAPFAWEAAVKAGKTGQTAAITVEHRQDNVDPIGDITFEANDVFDNGAMDLGDVGTFGDFADGVPPQQAMSRIGSEVPEGGRRGSQASSQQALPWQNMAFGHGDDDLPAGFDSSFSAKSLRLSIMTPQELRLRKRSIQDSSSQPRGRHARSRSLTGSLLGKHDQEPKMLIGDDDDLELPVDEFDLDITESQADKRADVPDAFKPEMLASLETSCRDFLSYIEREMLAKSVQSMTLEDIAPPTKTKRVGASAFYNCLTLATKRILSLTQDEVFGPITIELAA